AGRAASPRRRRPDRPERLRRPVPGRVPGPAERLVRTFSCDSDPEIANEHRRGGVAEEAPLLGFALAARVAEDPQLLRPRHGFDGTPELRGDPAVAEVLQQPAALAAAH